jgi:hypothetical protein
MQTIRLSEILLAAQILHNAHISCEASHCLEGLRADRFHRDVFVLARREGGHTG